MAAIQRRISLTALLGALVVLLPACPGSEAQPPTQPRVVGSPTETSRQRLTRAERFERAMERCREERRRVADNRFIPPISQRDGNVVLPVVFPDGSTAELTYPPRLKLHRLGVQPAISLGLRARGKDHGRFLIITKTPVDEFARTDKILESYEGPLGTVRVFRPQRRREFLHPLLIHHRAGSWNIIVGDGNAGSFMGKRNRRLWAESLDAFETESGFIVVEPRPPLTFARDSGNPQLLLNSCFRSIDLRRERCEDLKSTDLAKDQYAETVRGVTVHRSERRNTLYANWCTPSRLVSVYLDDHDKRFVDLAVKRLRVRSVNPSEQFGSSG